MPLSVGAQKSNKTNGYRFGLPMIPFVLALPYKNNTHFFQLNLLASKSGCCSCTAMQARTGSSASHNGNHLFCCFSEPQRTMALATETGAKVAKASEKSPHASSSLIMALVVGVCP